MSGALDDVKLHLVDDMETLMEFKSWLGTTHDENTLGIDTETEGLNPYSGELVRLIQIGDTMHGWAFIPTWHGAALEVLRDWEGDWVAHNLKFDVNFLRTNYPGGRYGYTPNWQKMHDTMTLAHLEDPTRSRGLKPLSAMLVDPRAASSQAVLDKEMNLNNWDWKTVPIVKEGAGSSYWIYAALDPVLTCRMFVYFKHIRETYRHAYELEMGTVRCIANMEFKGARVDLAYSDRMVRTIEEYSGQVRQWIRDAHGVQSAGSMAQCIARFEQLGRTITKFTKSGNKSLDKEQLETFLEEATDGQPLPGDDLAKALLDLRKGEKQVGPYFSNFQKMADSNGYVHPTIWPVGTRTARMSVSSPALQTLPRKDPTVRTAFIPSDGNCLIAIDADQIELRLATHLSRDEGLRAAFATGADFFSTIASEAYHESIAKDDPRRQLLKNGVYATLYGAGVTKIATTAGVSVHEMELVMARFHEQYPGIRRLQEQITNIAKQRGATEGRPYVYTGMGRKMFGDPGREYALVNYAIQSSAAELLKQGICDLDAVGLGEYLILPVHDELVLDVPLEDQQDVLMKLTETLNAVGKDYFVPVTWGPDVMNKTWGDKYRKDGAKTDAELVLSDGKTIKYTIAG